MGAPLALRVARPSLRASASRVGALALSTVRWAAWLLCAAALLLLTTYPVSTDAQLTLGVAAIGSMAALWWLAPRTRLSRMAFLAVGSAVVLRYVVWRVTSTLPSASSPLEFGLGVLLLGAELYCVAILAVSLLVNADPLERAAPAFPDDEAALPTVDVFIPTYNEDEYILATTVAAAKALDYPAAKLTVWLLDDGGTDGKCADPDPAKAAAARARRASLQALCAALGARYLTRARNEHAKAGNLNNGLRASSGEIVVVFDADHAPFRPFLRETIGHFAADPKLFLVQTPHVFLNPDPIEKNLRTFDRMPSENEMFYGVTQRGLDKWNGSFFCGSAALLRRKALETTNGFSGITVTEDCETAFELHAQGWTSVYVDKPLIAGLQPETLSSFIGQRSRWCQGMFQILLLKNPALKPGLKPIQRLAYLSSMTFWFFPLPRLMFMLAPLLHIFLDVKIFVSSVDEAIAYTATYVVVNMLMQNYLYGRVRWPWMSELYEYVQGVFLAKAIASVIWSPRKPTFNVTAKGVALDREHLSPLAVPFVVIFALLLAGCGTAAWRYAFEPGVTNLMLVVGLWCGTNLVLAAAALGVVAERPLPERVPGLPADRRGTLVLDGVAHRVLITRVSPAGCTVRLADGSSEPLPRDGEGLGRLTADPASANAPVASLAVAVAAPAAPDRPFDLRFPDLAKADYAAVADLMYGDVGPLARFLEGRRSHKSLPAAAAEFLRWSVTEPVRALSYAVRTGRPADEAAAAEPVASGREAGVNAPEVLRPAGADAAPSPVTETAPVVPHIVGPEPVEQHGGRDTVARTAPAVPGLSADAWRLAILDLAGPSAATADADPEVGGSATVVELRSGLAAGDAKAAADGTLLPADWRGAVLSLSAPPSGGNERVAA